MGTWSAVIRSNLSRLGRPAALLETWTIPLTGQFFQEPPIFWGNNYHFLSNAPNKKQQSQFIDPSIVGLVGRQSCRCWTWRVWAKHSGQSRMGTGTFHDSSMSWTEPQRFCFDHFWTKLPPRDAQKSWHDFGEGHRSVGPCRCAEAESLWVTKWQESMFFWVMWWWYSMI